MAILPVQEDVVDAAPVYVGASAGGDEFPNDGGVHLMIKGGLGKTLTVPSPHAGREDYSRLLVSNSVLMPRFEPLWWNDRLGHVALSFDDVVGVSLAVVRIGVIGVNPDAAPLPALF